MGLYVTSLQLINNNCNTSGSVNFISLTYVHFFFVILKLVMGMFFKKSKILSLLQKIRLQ